MAEGVTYDVNAFLRTQGSFGKEAKDAARSADMLGSSWSRMGDKMVSMADRVRGSFGAVASDFAKTGAVAIGGALTAGIAAATVKGVEFNNTMEQGALAIGTMYQAFGVDDSFQKNVEYAKAMQKELVRIADLSPGTTEDIMTAYQALAPGVTGVTQDLQRQLGLMEKIAVLGWATGNDYKQLGADVGRIVTGVAGADVATFRTLAPTIKEAFKEVTGDEIKSDFTQQFNELAKADGEKALQIFEKAISKIGDESNKAFGESFGGVMATFESRLMKLAGDFGKPLFDSMREVMSKDVMGDGPFSAEALPKLREIAFFSGGLIADAFERGASALISAVDYVANNWRSIAETIRDAGVAAGKAIQVAIAVGATRYIVGTAMAAAGKAMAGGSALIDAAKPIAKFVAAQTAQTHMGLARGMKGGGTGMIGAMGRGMGGVFGKADGRKDPLNIFRGMDKGLLKITSLVTTIGSLGIVAGMAATALGVIGVAIGGVAAYFMEHWKRISGTIVQGLRDGTITLVPLITSLYTFWLRLKLVGEALMGGSTAIGTVNGGLNFLTSAVDLASGALSYFIKAMSIMVGAWGALKLGMLGVMKLIMMIVDVANTLGVVSDDALANAQYNYDKFSEGVDETFHTADKLASAADAIANAQLSPLDYQLAEEKARELEKRLADVLSGKTAADPKGTGRAHKPAVKIDKIEIVVKTDDPDPDRLFAQFIPKLVAMADRRVQPYDALPEGGR